MQAYWIWLCGHKGLSHGDRLRLLDRFGDVQRLYQADKAALDAVAGLSPEGKAALLNKSLDEARRILRRCARLDIRVLTWQDGLYPDRLRSIPDPPMVLYYRGRLPGIGQMPAIGVVGTRHASAYGLSAARQLGRQITACGGLVISGFAMGVDALAMEGALSAGGTTVGVLGCGVDICYPSENRPLYDRVLERGCLISEYPPGTKPNRWNFPQRNRIISGLSCGVLVVEAPEKSGALITARQAAQQGRDVFVVPGNLGVDSCAGSNRLLREGAGVLVTSGWEILEEYQGIYPACIHPDDSPAEAPEERQFARQNQAAGENSRIKKEKDNKNVIDNGVCPPYSDLNKDLPELPGEQGLLVKLLRSGSRNVDELIAESGLEPAVAVSALTVLELQGHIRRLPGRQVTLN